MRFRRFFSRDFSNFPTSNLFSRYDTFIRERPLLTQMITAGAMRVVGDVVAQQFFEKKPKHDFVRTLRMGGFGVFYWAPSCNLW